MKRSVRLLFALLLCLALASCIPPRLAAQAPGPAEGIPPGTVPPGATPSGIPYADLEAFVNEYVTARTGAVQPGQSAPGVSSPGAAVVIVKDGEIVLSRGYGLADIASGTPVDAATTVFEYGSVSKLFVYTTLMALVEQGRIDLSADIRTYLPDGFLRGLRYDEPVTLLDVMNHQTGFEDVVFDVVVTPPGITRSWEDTLRDAQPEQIYPPGTVSAYSNYAVALAASIAQEIIGRPYDAYLMDTVFEPLGMDATSADPFAYYPDRTSAARPDLAAAKATGYRVLPDGHAEPKTWSYIALYPVGSLNGTAEDLARYAMALLPPEGESGPLFEERATLDTMLSGTYAMGPGLPGWAHGFIEWDTPEGTPRALGHGGNTAFFSAQINIVPEERLGIVVLANAESEMAITAGLTDALLGHSLAVEPQPAAEPAADLPPADAVTGTYITARKPHHTFVQVYPYLSLLSVTATDNGGLQLSVGGQSATYVQTAPYRYEQTSATGGIFLYHLLTIYFGVEDGRVWRMSGDWVPLPAVRTVPWLIVDGVLLGLSALYLLLAVVGLAIAAVVRRIRSRRLLGETMAAGGPALPRATAMVALPGLALLVNSAIAGQRMLADNYRSFAEVRPQVLLNYLFALVALVGVGLVAALWRRVPATRGQRAFAIATGAAVLVVLILMVKWGFFGLLY